MPSLRIVFLLISFGFAMLLMSTDVGSAREKRSEIRYVAHFLQIRESGGFGQKSWREMDSKEVLAVATAVCAYYGCLPLVPIIKNGIHQTQVQVGNDFATSGVVHKHDGEQWWIAFPPPVGYVTCSAKYDPKSISANRGDATTGTLFRNPATGEDWVGTYSVVPQNRPEGHWAIVNMIVKYVKRGTETRHSCAPNGSPIWRVYL